MSTRCARRALFKSNLCSVAMVGIVMSALMNVTALAELFQNNSYSAPKTTIKYAMFGGAGEVAITEQICRMFVEENPDVSVDAVVYPWAQYWTKVQVQAASGLAPDVITLYSGNIGLWVENGAILPLDEFMRDSGFKREDYYAAAMDVCTWHGLQYCMPLEISVRTLVYSADRFEERGIPRDQWPAPDKPISWQRFKDLAAQLTFRNPDGTISQYGMASGQLWNQTMYRMFGGDMLDGAVEPNRPTVAGNEKFFQGVAEVFRMQYTDRTMLGLHGLSAGGVENVETLLISPRFAMATTGPWALVTMKQAGVNFRFAPMPENVYPSQLINVNAVGIYSHSKNPRQAWRFIRFLASQEAQSLVGRKLKGVPALISAKDAFIHNEFGIEGCEAFLCQLPIAVPEVTSSKAFVTAEVSKWGERLEQRFAVEYESKYKSLPRPKGVISAGDYAKFTVDMNTFIENTVRQELPILDNDLRAAFERSKMPPPDFKSKFFFPGIALSAMTCLVVFYVMCVRKYNAMPRAGYRSNNAAGLLCVSPWLFGFLCFSLLPILAAIYLSLTDWNMIRPPVYVGLRNYFHLISDDFFRIGLMKTFKYAALVIPISLAGGLFTAGLLTCNIRGAAFFKSIIYFPSLFADAAAAVLWVNMFNRDYGVINNLLSYVGISPINWMDAAHAFYAIILMNFFWIGSSMIIYYAGMKQIPASLYEAAEIDGAGPVRKFISITIPMLSPVIMFMVVITTIGAFQVFTPALFFSPDAAHLGSPADSLRFYSVNIYNEAFNYLRMGNACCYAVILFILIFVITMVQMKLAKRFVHSETAV